ncbi:hypothetical protein FOL47_002318 [Perkinsus chesapeaki]|uniref:Uncharacterized protein n=1 Tax=Perkinsus chesapeaki TaxID=330153 RepID=A0A7J6MEN7_PERCH|nr:hypothetical protein FOL47_002318 [Perkinsus chesapeaki]
MTTYDEAKPRSSSGGGGAAAAERHTILTKAERTMSASTAADMGSPSAIPRSAEEKRPRRESEDSVKSKLELAIRRTSCSPLTNAGTKSAPDGTLLVYRTESMATAVKANAFLKTKMCPKLRMTSNGEWACPQGDRCSFAHSESELRSLPNLTKTAICYEQVYGKCGCKNGSRCKYAHSEEELRKYVPQAGATSRHQQGGRSPIHPKHGSGDSTTGWLKRKGSRASESAALSGGSGRRYSKDSASSGVKHVTEQEPQPKPIDLPALRARALEIACELPDSAGKHLEISKAQLVDLEDDPCIQQYLCSICGALASPTPDPTIASSCTHVTCARCFEGWRRANVEQEPKLKTLPCPACGCPLRKGVDVFPLDESVEGPIAALRRVYSKIQINCRKTDDITAVPCEWVGSVRDFPEHMVVCHHWECTLKCLPTSAPDEDTVASAKPAFSGNPLQSLDGPPRLWEDILASSSGLSEPPILSPSGPPSSALPPHDMSTRRGQCDFSASPSTTATIPMTNRIWASSASTHHIDEYSATSSICSDMFVTGPTPDRLTATSTVLDDDAEVDSVYCEVICSFLPYGSSADKMLSMTEGEVLLYSSATDDGQWSLVKRQSTGEQGWVPTGYLRAAALTEQEESVHDYSPADVDSPVGPPCGIFEQDDLHSLRCSTTAAADDDDNGLAVKNALLPATDDTFGCRNVSEIYYTDVKAGGAATNSGCDDTCETPPFETAQMRNEQQHSNDGFYFNYSFYPPTGPNYYGPVWS